MATAIFSDAEEHSDKKILIDFSDARRTSFLPNDLIHTFEKPEVNLKSIKVLECHEDDELFMYVGGDECFNESRPLHKFCTGSKYLGEWNKLGLCGKGIYKFPHGVIYDGYFNKNGQFHGSGVLVYPNGQKIEGIWRNGKMATESNNFVTKAGVIMTKSYCKMPDRRFQIELEKDLNPPGQEYLTDEPPPPRKLPDNCYDVVEGFYDPKVKTVYEYPKQAKADIVSITDSNNKPYNERLLTHSPSDINQVSQKTESEISLDELIKVKQFDHRKVVSWIPSSAQEEWIIKNCRKAWDQCTGYRPDLYEEWTRRGAYSTCNVENEHAYDSEFASQLDILHLSVKKSKSEQQKLKTFVKKKQEQQESMTIDMLTKMFLSASASKINFKKSGSINNVKVANEKTQISDLSFEFEMPNERR